ncbi:MAG: M81 family metallopeptidase [Planctomycetaceae bacterium]|nr:M81 family metallopeptidase [Planctomycetaceae bacterium]
MRIAVAEIVQETGSFSPMAADLKDFEPYGLFFGDEIFERVPDAGPIGGFREIAAQQKTPVIQLPLVRAWGGAGGTITSATFDFLSRELSERLRAAMPVDAVFLSLHGAAASENEDDVEGSLLEDVRRIVGPTTPIVVAVDHHANITRRMVENANALIGHETQPHDPKETGRKAAGILFRMLNDGLRVTVAWQKIPMITPQDQFLTSQGPMKEWFDLARSMERRARVVDVSPYPMQPWLDVREGGWAVVVHTDNDLPLAQSLAAEMARAAWSRRAEFWRSERVAAADAVRQAATVDSGLVILSDTGDSVYGGAPGDSTVILSELVRQNVPTLTLVPLIDPHALEAALKTGVGSRFEAEVGARIDARYYKPVRIVGRVAAVSQGVTVELPERGVCDIGRAALIEVGQVRLVLIEDRTFAINHPVLYWHLGLDVAAARGVVVKTASNFQFFAPWRTRLIRVDSPGMTQSDLTAFTWKRTPRPIYPFDPIENWKPE